MISFDTNILVYATASVPDVKALRARDLIGRAMRAEWTILLLQTLAEFANVAIRKAGIPIEDIRRTIDAWRAVLPIQAADVGDLAAALEAIRAHRLPFWDAMLCQCLSGSEQVVGADRETGSLLLSHHKLRRGAIPGQALQQRPARLPAAQ